MKREEHTALIQKLRTLIPADSPSIGEITELLANLSEDYTQTTTTLDNTNLQMESLKNQNESLRSFNAKLFEKVGVQEKKDDPEIPAADKDPFAALFDDKGGLK